MPSEIELKLSVTSAQARRLATQPALAAVKPQRYRLFNTYYDTSGLDLYRRGIALRLRRKGRSEWLMTVKGGDPAGGALARRSEWEAPTQPGVFASWHSSFVAPGGSGGADELQARAESERSRELS